MLTKELVVKQKENLDNLEEQIGDGDIELLIEWLKEKDDTIRYTAFQLLQSLSKKSSRVYKLWDSFTGKLDDINSYQRSLALMLISENVKWDKEDKFGSIYNKYLKRCNDEKFITTRQCIQGLHKILEHSTKYKKEIVDSLLGIDLSKRKESQRNLLLLDIINVLGKIFNEQREERIRVYFEKAYEHGDDKVRNAIKKYLEI